MRVLKFFFISSILWINFPFNLQAKTAFEYATDLIAIKTDCEKFFQQFNNWPKNLQQLETEGFLDTIDDVDIVISKKEYHIYNSNGDFAIGIVQDLISVDQLSGYLGELSSFAGYHWLFIQQNNTKQKQEDIDYYEQQLPFFSNLKQIIKGKIFNPTN